MEIPNSQEILQIESEAPKSKADSLDKFNKLISQSNDKIKFIEKKLKELISIKTSLSEADKDEEINISKKITNINDDITEARGYMDKIIKDLEAELDEAERKCQSSPTDTKKEKDEIVNSEIDLRTKRNLFDAMIKKYQRVIQKFSDEQSDMKKIKETKLIRDAEIGIGRDLTEEEKGQVMENPKIVEQIYKERLKGPGHTSLINAVRDLEDRHKDIKKLEKSIIELHKMVTDLSKLVQYQGEMIDNIVEYVSKSKDYIAKGEEELAKGKKNMEKARKKKCIIAIIASVILLIIIIPIIAKFV